MQNSNLLKLKHLLCPPPNHHKVFVFFTLLGVILFSATLKELARFSLGSNTYSHILFIPIMSLYLIFPKRTWIFSSTYHSFAIGLPILFASSMFYVIGRQNALLLSPNDALCVATLSAIAFWIGAFITSYGVQSYRNARFPLFLLIFMIPLPDSLYEMIVYVLQRGSLEVAYWIFKMTGVAVSRNGFVLCLPDLDIEVAKACSGIRSTMALFITSLLAGHLFLKKSKNRVFLALIAVLIAVFKNGVRIVTLSLLAIHINMGILSGSLHRKGGIPFFILALALLAATLRALRRMEEPPAK